MRRLYSGVHRLLLRLAGRLPDELITRARTMLATGDLAYLPDTVTLAAAARAVPLTAEDVEVLREVFAALGIDGEPAGADDITITMAVPMTGHTFSPDRVRPPRVPAGFDLTGGVPGELADLEDDLLDLADHLVVDALRERAGVVAVWRAWRDGPTDVRRIYLAEVTPDVPAWELVLEAQTELSQAGERDPQVEAYWTGDDLPPYHCLAREAAVLLWRR